MIKISLLKKKLQWFVEGLPKLSYKFVLKIIVLIYLKIHKSSGIGFFDEEWRSEQNGKSENS